MRAVSRDSLDVRIAVLVICMCILIYLFARRISLSMMRAYASGVGRSSTMFRW
jgi:hypothetical protein